MTKTTIQKIQKYEQKIKKAHLKILELQNSCKHLTQTRTKKQLTLQFEYGVSDYYEYTCSDCNKKWSENY